MIKIMKYNQDNSVDIFLHVVDSVMSTDVGGQPL